MAKALWRKVGQWHSVFNQLSLRTDDKLETATEDFDGACAAAGVRASDLKELRECEALEIEITREVVQGKAERRSSQVE
ncbi:hypothetical protein cyc_06626 [Cyclospora cayetanensis]|uniref:Uncharacterized protein n=1 Tax=Cyclospora cayetanensis TaxID=88456 RepID=A0A1D3CSE9_9EIME|nr:hypothetical protein cyc_06626 [Cyclospora cayetanensis]